MEPENMQANNQDQMMQSPDMAQQGSDMTPEDAKASLGIATRLSEQYLMSQAPPMEENSPQTPNPTPQQEDQKSGQSEDSNIDVKLDEMEARLTEKIESMSKISDDSKELADVKKQLEEILNEDD